MVEMREYHSALKISVQITSGPWRDLWSRYRLTNLIPISPDSTNNIIQCSEVCTDDGAFVSVNLQLQMLLLVLQSDMHRYVPCVQTGLLVQLFESDMAFGVYLGKSEWFILHFGWSRRTWLKVVQTSAFGEAKVQIKQRDSISWLQQMTIFHASQSCSIDRTAQ